MPRGDNWKNVYCQAPDCVKQTKDDGRYCPMHYRRLQFWGMLERPPYYGIDDKYIVDSNDCWLWQGTINQGGYAQKSIKRKFTLMHRFMYSRYKGEIPKGLVIDHLCRVRHCVNPEHMEAVTNGENVLRGMSFTARNKRKTHCSKGHEYGDNNFYMLKVKRGNRISNNRICKTCSHERYMRKTYGNKMAVSKATNTS